MKIFLAQQNYHIGNFAANTAKIIDAIRTAKAAGGDFDRLPGTGRLRLSATGFFRV